MLWTPSEMAEAVRVLRNGTWPTAYSRTDVGNGRATGEGVPPPRSVACCFQGAEMENASVACRSRELTFLLFHHLFLLLPLLYS